MPTVVAPLAGAWVEIQWAHLLNEQEEVAPLAGAWVEMQSKSMADWKRMAVAPLAGAWVEITILNTIKNVVSTSLPSRERGLK